MFYGYPPSFQNFRDENTWNIVVHGLLILRGTLTIALLPALVSAFATAFASYGASRAVKSYVSTGWSPPCRDLPKFGFCVDMLLKSESGSFAPFCKVWARVLGKSGIPQKLEDFVKSF